MNTNIFAFQAIRPYNWLLLTVFFCLSHAAVSAQNNPPTCAMFKIGTDQAAGIDDTICLPVSVYGFNHVSSMQYRIEYDMSRLEYVGVNVPPNVLPGFSDSPQDNIVDLDGAVRFGWAHPSATSTTLADSTVLYALCFRVKTAFNTSAVRFNLQGIPLGEVGYEDPNNQNLYTNSATFLDGMTHFGALPVNYPDLSASCITSGINCSDTINVDITALNTVSYLWTGNGQSFTMEDINTDSFGVFQLQLTNGGLLRNASFILKAANALSLPGIIPVTCSFGPGDCIIPIVSGGAVPYSYLWQDGSTNAALCFPITGNAYSFTVTDANGCTVSNSGTIVLPAPLSVQITLEPTCLGESGSVTSILASGGTPPYLYTFSLFQNPFIPVDPSALDAGVYDVTVTDAGGCTQVTTFTIESNQIFELTVQCPGVGNTGDLLLSLIPGSDTTGFFPVTVFWSNGTVQVVNALQGDTLAYLSGLPEGVYTVGIASPNCSGAYQAIVDCTPFAPNTSDSTLLVWPGDADNNNAVNHHDLLYLGLGMGTTGPVRANADLDWEGQPASDWAQFTNTFIPVNFKHFDTNGDGLLSSADTTAISQNWGQVVNIGTDNPFAMPGIAQSIGIPVLMGFGPDTAVAGTILALPVFLGTENTPVNDITGLSFSISYDPSLLTPLGFEPVNSLFGTPGTNVLSMHRDFSGQQRFDVALTNTTGTQCDGFGIIGTFFIIVEDDIFLRDGRDVPEFSPNSTEIYTNLYFSNIYTTNSGGGTTPIIEAPSYTLPVTPKISRQSEPFWANRLSVVPNPAQDMVRISCPGIALETIRLLGADGRVVVQRDCGANDTVQIQVSALASGLYTLQIITAQGSILKKVVVVR